MEFVQHALCSKPRLLVLIMPETNYHPPGYRHQYRHQLSSASRGRREGDVRDERSALPRWPSMAFDGLPFDGLRWPSMAMARTWQPPSFGRYELIVRDAKLCRGSVFYTPVSGAFTARAWAGYSRMC